MATRSEGGSLVIRLDGVFDKECAQKVGRELAALPEGAEAYLDLSQVRQFHDLAVAVLGDVLAAANGRVSVRGLRQHQYRMLRYLGVSSSTLSPMSPASSAEERT